MISVGKFSKSAQVDSKPFRSQMGLVSQYWTILSDNLPPSILVVMIFQPQKLF